MQATAPENQAALLEGTGLTEASLSISDSISAEQQIRVFSNAGKLATNPDWALALGQQLNVNSHGSLGFAALSAPTLGESLEILAAYARIRTPYLFYESGRIGDRFRFTVRPAIELDDIGLTMDELVLQVAEASIKAVLGYIPNGMNMMLAHSPPIHAADYPRYFISPCRFDQPVSGVELPQRFCAVPCPLYDEQSFATSVAQCRTALAAIIDPADVVARTRNLLEVHFEQLSAGTAISGAPVLEDVARSLNMSPRTLIRQLAAQGHGYRELLERAQKNTASELLGQARYSISEIAVLLGYSDAANFGRAFRRWFDMSPGQYRRR